MQEDGSKTQNHTEIKQLTKKLKKVRRLVKKTQRRGRFYLEVILVKSQPLQRILAGYFKPRLEGWLIRAASRLISLESSLSKGVWRSRRISVSLLGLAVLSLQLHSQWLALPRTQLARLDQQLNHYPLLPQSYLNLATYSLDLGQLERTQDYLNQAQAIISLWPWLGFDFASQTAILQTRLDSVANSQSTLHQIEQQLTRFPYASNLWLERAKLEASLFMPTDLALTLNTVHWLDPHLDLSAWQPYLATPSATSLQN